MNKKGFTLIELLAVIVILVLVLAIAVPTISSIVDNSKRNAFESNAKLLLKTIQIKLLENSDFNLADINSSTVESLLGIDGDNYSYINAKYDSNGKVYLGVKGQGEWSNLTAYGNFETISLSPDIVLNGLVLYLDPSNKTGYSGSVLINDLSGNGNNGTLYNGVTYNALNDGHFVFDGSNDYVNVGNSNTLKPMTFTYSLWIKFSVSQKMRILMGYHSDSLGGASIGIDDATADLIKFHTINYSVGNRINSTMPLNDGVWHML